MAQYDPIAVAYDQLMGETGDIPHVFLIDPILISLLPNNNLLTVLDAGCGNGYWSKILAKKYQKVVGIDNSQELLKIAQNKRRLSNIKYLQADLEEKISFEDNSFDLIFSNMVIHYIKNIDQFIKESYRLLKSGGHILLAFVHPDYELLKNTSIKIHSGRTPYQAETLGGMAKLTLQYESLNSIINRFENTGFKLIKKKDAVITEELTRKYHRYKEYLGLPRAAILMFEKY